MPRNGRGTGMGRRTTRPARAGTRPGRRTGQPVFCVAAPGASLRGTCGQRTGAIGRRVHGSIASGSGARRLLESWVLGSLVPWSVREQRRCSAQGPGVADAAGRGSLGRATWSLRSRTGPPPSIWRQARLAVEVFSSAARAVRVPVSATFTKEDSDAEASP